MVACQAARTGFILVFLVGLILHTFRSTPEKEILLWEESRLDEATNACAIETIFFA